MAGNYSKSSIDIRNNSRRAWCDISDNSIIPPWCSSRRARERQIPRNVSPSLYPPRKNLREYLNSHKPGNDDISKKNKKMSPTQVKVKRSIYRNVNLLLFLLFILIVSIDSTSVGEECCHRMRHLELALRRAEHALSKAHRVRKTVLISQNLDSGTQQAKPNNKRYIEGASAFKGSDTVEWGAQAAIWGVVPLRRAAPRPDIILSLRRPLPSDCWPFRGSSGEVIIELPRTLRVDLISLEHIRPDTARSAPKNFTVYGVLANGTWIKTADGMYQHNKAAKQYYSLDNSNPSQQVVFRVLSNQGNPNYTCVYRIHLYSSFQ